jgi:hypothetical protein
MNCNTNRKLYGALLAALFLAVSFLTSCSSSSSSTTPPPPPPPTTTNFAFYVSGEDTLPAGSDDLNYYALAGAVTIDASGNVTGGEEDYNDAAGTASAQPDGDAITGGTLTVDPTSGQGTLTLITGNTALGSSSTPGTETLAVQFVNADHALITQFDGSATSSGSMDLQTLGGTPSGGFAFTFAGVDAGYNPVAWGGVFTIGGAATDLVDVNDDGTATLGATLTTFTLGTPDSFGRGTITTSVGYIIDAVPTPLTLNYYVVGPEAIRIIDVDTDSAAVGSAFGQGTATGAFANTSVPASIFAISSGSGGFGAEYGVAGQFTPDSTPTPATYSGVAEEVELGAFVSGAAAPVGGSFSLATNGYGSATIAGFGGGDVSALQIYATDPAINVNDPNNTQTDVGGALLLDADDVLSGGIGVVVPQTDTTSTDFSGNYAAGWQNFNSISPTVCTGCEFDMVAQGSMASGGALSLTAEVSDPFQTLGAGGAFGPGTFTGTPTPDEGNPGRLTMLSTDANGPLTSVIGAATPSFDVIIYQASASTLFWLEYDENSVFVGPIEAQGSLTGIPSVARPVKTQMKRK